MWSSGNMCLHPLAALRRNEALLADRAVWLYADVVMGTAPCLAMSETVRKAGRLEFLAQMQ